MNTQGIGIPLFKVLSKAGKLKQTYYLAPADDNSGNPNFLVSYKAKGGDYLQVVPNEKADREISSYLGRSGAGKTFQSACYISEWLKQHKKGNVYIFSPFEDDPTLENLDKKRVKRIKLGDEFVNADISIAWFKDSLVMFDDIDVIRSRLVKNKINSIMSSILQGGRHFNISMLITSHSFCGQDNKITINESHKITVFPNVGLPKTTQYLLENYRGMHPKQVAHLGRGHGRWVTVHASDRTVIITPTKAYILNAAPLEIELEI